MATAAQQQVQQQERARKLGIRLGATGLVLLFGPAIALAFFSPAYATYLLALMVLGIVLVSVAFVKTPRMRRPKA